LPGKRLRGGIVGGMKFKSKRLAWNSPSKKSNETYLKNYEKIFKKDIKNEKKSKCITNLIISK
jgi:hypothetical protein